MVVGACLNRWRIRCRNPTTHATIAVARSRHAATGQVASAASLRAPLTSTNALPETTAGETTPAATETPVATVSRRAIAPAATSRTTAVAIAMTTARETATATPATEAATAAETT